MRPAIRGNRAQKAGVPAAFLLELIEQLDCSAPFERRIAINIEILDVGGLRGGHGCASF